MLRLSSKRGLSRPAQPQTTTQKLSLSRSSLLPSQVLLPASRGLSTSRVTRQEFKHGEPKILNETSAPSFDAAHASSAASPAARRKKGMLLLVLALLMIIPAVALIKEDLERRKTEEELARWAAQNPKKQIPTTAATVQPAEVLQRVIDSVKSNFLISAAEEEAAEEVAPETVEDLTQAAAEIAVGVVDKELEEALLASQREASELKQHIRELQTKMRKEKEAAEAHLVSALVAERQAGQKLAEEAVESKEREFRTILDNVVEQERIKAEQEMQAKVAEKEHELFVEFTAKNMENQQDLENLKTLVSAVDSAWGVQEEFFKNSKQTHALNAAVGHLTAILEKHSPAKPQLERLVALASDDAVMKAVVASFPEELADSGVPSLADLQHRFKDTVKDVKAASYSPDEGLLGSVFGRVASVATLNERGLVDGHSPEAILARTQFFLDHHNLGGAVREVQNLDGPSAAAAASWLKDAENRLLVEQNTKLLQAHVQSLHSELASL